MRQPWINKVFYSSILLFYSTSGWLDSLLYPYTKMSSAVCRVKKMISSKYF